MEITLAALSEVVLERGAVAASRASLQEALDICVARETFSNALRILVGVVLLLGRTGRDELAAGLLAFVEGHRASTAQMGRRPGGC